jgi:AAA domain
MSLWQVERDFLNVATTERRWHVPAILARGVVTALVGWRGSGKTHLAHGLLAGLAADHRVAIVDVDNPRDELRRRLRAWPNADRIEVFDIDSIPPFGEVEAWETFPDYDVVLVDSLDVLTLGHRVAPLLRLARRPKPPAVLVLANTPKSQAPTIRGDGRREDRLDIILSVERMPAPAEVLRLKLTPTKFRVGPTPEPFAFTVDMSGSTWTMSETNVSAEAGALAQRGVTEILSRLPIARVDAVEVLRKIGLGRDATRALIAGGPWIQERAEHQRGRPITLCPRESSAGINGAVA